MGFPNFVIKNQNKPGTLCSNVGSPLRRGRWSRFGLAFPPFNHLRGRPEPDQRLMERKPCHAWYQWKATKILSMLTYWEMWNDWHAMAFFEMNQKFLLEWYPRSSLMRGIGQSPEQNTWVQSYHESNLFSWHYTASSLLFSLNWSWTLLLIL
jgi:hypothetical protein